MNFNIFIRYSFCYNLISSFEFTIANSGLYSGLNGFSAESIGTTMMSKDAISNLLTLFYISKFSNKIDINPNKYLFGTQLMNQGAFNLCLISKYINDYYLQIAIMSSVGITLNWTALGSLNAKILCKFDASRIGEYYSKLSIINTISSSIGTGLALSYKYLLQTEGYEVNMLFPLRLYLLSKMIDTLKH